MQPIPPSTIKPLTLGTCGWLAFVLAGLLALAGTVYTLNQGTYLSQAIEVEATIVGKRTETSQGRTSSSTHYRFEIEALGRDGRVIPATVVAQRAEYARHSPGDKITVLMDPGDETDVRAVRTLDNAWAMVWFMVAVSLSGAACIIVDRVRRPLHTL